MRTMEPGNFDGNAPELIVTLGEALVDMVGEAGDAGGLADAVTFHRAAGGAPANVAVGAARLGAAAGFVGKVGADPFGDHLIGTFVAEGVDVSQVSRSEEFPTALAFVSHGAAGEREFTFYRHAAADLQLRPDDFAHDYVAGAALLHVGSLSLTAEPARSATYAALEVARGAGVPRSVDPNLRLDQWPDAATARRTVIELSTHASVLKVSEEELEFLAGSTGALGAASLMHEDLLLLCVTRGAAGVEYYTPSAAGSVAGFAVRPVDTTGAGDAFVAALLVGLSRTGGLEDALDDLALLERILLRANAFAALTVTRKGAIPAMPSLTELEAFLGK